MAVDPVCGCGHFIRLHSHMFGCTQCDCGHDSPRPTQDVER